MKTVALYARVSTKLQEEERTIESQLQALIDHAKKQEDWIIPKQHIYTDDGYSGGLLARPALDTLRDAAQERAFDNVLILSPDRLARKYAYQELVVDELRDLGIELIFLTRPKAETDEDKIFQGFQGLFAEYEKMKIAERCRRGKLYKARGGKIVGGIPPYGYTYIRKTESEDGCYVINEKEAEVVRMMFDWVADEGLSIRGVVRRFHERGIKTRSGEEKWSKSTISRILKNETYIGRTYYNKFYSSIPETTRRENAYKRTKKNSRRYRPKEEWIPIRGIPKIVDEDEFWRVQKQLEENSVFSLRNAKHRYLLRGLMVCGECSSRWFGDFSKGYPYYRCGNRLKRFPSPRTCSANSMRADKVEPAVWDCICDLVNNPSLITEQVRKLQEKMRSKKPMYTERVSSLDKGLQRLKGEEERLVEAYGKEIITLKQLETRLAGIKKERGILEERKAALESWGASNEGRLLDLNLGSVTHLCKLVGERLKQFSFEEKQKFLRLVTDEIIIRNSDLTIRGAIPLKHLPAFVPPDQVELRPQLTDVWPTGGGKDDARPCVAFNPPKNDNRGGA